MQQLVLKNHSTDREYICTCRWPAGKVKKGRPHCTIASAPDFSLHFLTHYKGNCPDRLLVGAKYFSPIFSYRGTQQKKSYRTENNLAVSLPLLLGTTTHDKFLVHLETSIIVLLQGIALGTDFKALYIETLVFIRHGFGGRKLAARRYH